ncbi:hypothetical protein KO465_04910 [Candidatus Micrarchaeota archaeon]|jgi:hypothetical protein|nr:hypothetical protein [Candidatus Micrarchaeota archaeon]
MSDISVGIEEVLRTRNDILIWCPDKKIQEATRVSGFHARRKMGRLAEHISFQKVEIDKELYVRIYVKDNLKLFTIGENGKPIEHKPIDSEYERMIELMKEDGKSEKEIQDFIDSIQVGEENGGE